MKKYAYWSGAAVCFMLASVFVLLPVEHFGLLVTLRVLALPMLVVAFLFVAAALAQEKPLADGLGEQTQVYHGDMAFPAHLTLEEKAEGSLRGAIRALERLKDSFRGVSQWQLERMTTACKQLEQRLADEPQLAREMADFCIQYLPHAMQYILQSKECGIETPQAMGYIATACERQLEAICQGKYITFEQEYQQLKQDWQALQEQKFIALSSEE